MGVITKSDTRLPQQLHDWAATDPVSLVNVVPPVFNAVPPVTTAAPIEKEEPLIYLLLIRILMASMTLRDL